MYERNFDWLPSAHPSLGTWPTTQACILIGNRTNDLEVLRPALSPLSYTSQGHQPLLLQRPHWSPHFYLCPLQSTVLKATRGMASASQVTCLCRPKPSKAAVSLSVKLTPSLQGQGHLLPFPLCPPSCFGRTTIQSKVLPVAPNVVRDPVCSRSLQTVVLRSVLSLIHISEPTRLS